MYKVYIHIYIYTQDHARLWAAGGRVAGAVRLAWLAGIGDSGAVALAAALPQMASLTALILHGRSTAAALGHRLWGFVFGAGASLA